MKDGWQTRPLGELCELRGGSTPSKGNSAYWAGGDIPWFTINDIREQGRSILSTTKTITQAALEDTSVKLLPAGSVLLCCTASVGEFAIARIPLTTNQQFVGLVVRDRTRLSPDFLFHFAATLKDELLRLSGKTTIDFVPLSRLRDVAVPLPSLADQQRIVGILDEAFAAIAATRANTEQNLRNSRELFERYLDAVFSERGEGWVQRSLAEICVVDWGNTDLTKSAYVKGGRYLAVSAAGCDGRIDHREHSRETPVLSAIGAQCGRMFLPDEDFTAIKNTITLTPRDGACTGKFLYRLLTHVDLPKRGAAQPFISKGDIQAFLVTVPTAVSVQRRVADGLDRIEEQTRRLESMYQHKLDALDALKQSLLREAFEGAL